MPRISGGEALLTLGILSPGPGGPETQKELLSEATCACALPFVCSWPYLESSQQLRASKGTVPWLGRKPRQVRRRKEDMVPFHPAE